VPVRVAPLRARLWIIAPIRLLLGAAVLVAAIVAGAGGRPALIGFAAGAAFLAFTVLSDRRSLLFADRERPGPLPVGAVHEPWWRTALDASIPSTIGVTVLAAIALATQHQVLAAILGGALAGMGIAAAIAGANLRLWERREGACLYLEGGGARRRFLEPV
jgi:hypothetical protein